MNECIQLADALTYPDRDTHDEAFPISNYIPVGISFPFSA